MQPTGLFFSFSASPRPSFLPFFSLHRGSSALKTQSISLSFLHSSGFFLRSVPPNPSSSSSCLRRSLQRRAPTRGLSFASSSFFLSSTFSSSSFSSPSQPGSSPLPRRPLFSLAFPPSSGKGRLRSVSRSESPFSSSSAKREEEEKEREKAEAGGLSEDFEDDEAGKESRRRRPPPEGREGKKKKEEEEEERKETVGEDEMGGEEQRNKTSAHASSSPSSCSLFPLESLFKEILSLEAFLSPPPTFPSLTSPICLRSASSSSSSFPALSFSVAPSLSPSPHSSSPSSSSSSCSSSSSVGTLYVLHTFRLHPYEFLLLEESLYRLLNHRRQPPPSSSSSSSVRRLRGVASPKFPPPVACVFLHHPPYCSSPSSSSSSSSRFSSSSSLARQAEEARADEKRGGTMASVVFGLSGRPERFVECPESILREKLAVFVKRFSGGGTVLVDGGEGLGCLCSSFLLPHSLSKNSQANPTTLMDFVTRFYQGKLTLPYPTYSKRRTGKSAKEDNEEEENFLSSFSYDFSPFSESFALRENDFVVCSSCSSSSLHSSSSPSSSSSSCSPSPPSSSSSVPSSEEEEEDGGASASRSASSSSLTLSSTCYKVGGNAQALSRLYSLQHTSFLWNEETLLPLVSEILRNPEKQPNYRRRRPHASFLKSVKSVLKEKMHLPPLSYFHGEASRPVCTLDSSRLSEEEDSDSLHDAEETSSSPSFSPVLSLSNDSLLETHERREAWSEGRDQDARRDEGRSCVQPKEKKTPRRRKEEEEAKKETGESRGGRSEHNRRVLELKEPRDVLLGMSVLVEGFVRERNHHNEVLRRKAEEDRKRESMLGKGLMGETQSMPGKVFASSPEEAREPKKTLGERKVPALEESTDEQGKRENTRLPGRAAETAVRQEEQGREQEGEEEAEGEEEEEERITWRCIHCALSPDDSFPLEFVEAWSRVYRHLPLSAAVWKEPEKEKGPEMEERENNFFSSDELTASLANSSKPLSEETQMPSGSSTVEPCRKEVISLSKNQEESRHSVLFTQNQEGSKKAEDGEEEEEEKKNRKSPLESVSRRPPLPAVTSSSSSALPEPCCLHVLRAKAVREMIGELTEGRMKLFRTTRFLSHDGRPLPDEVYRHLLEVNSLVPLPPAQKIKAG